MRYRMKMPFADLWFVDVNADGDLVFAAREFAMVLTDPKGFADYLPVGVDLSCFVLVPEEQAK